ncbi:MAG: ATP-binding protein [Thermodesulfobacteriota bacterium]
MNKETFSTVLFEWQGLIRRRGGVCRDLEAGLLRAMGSRPIKIVTGFRRSGKSFLVQQVARRLLDAGQIEPSNLLYLNLEDFRLMEVTSPERLNELYELFLSSSAKPGRRLLIFDEIQNVSAWDRFIRTIYERDGETVEIVLTGSNSELLSSELGSNLAGRFIEFSLLPFSFREFLAYRGLPIREEADYFRARQEVSRLFFEYLAHGGLPEVFDIPAPEAKISYLTGVVSKVILDDVVRRFRVDNVSLLEKLFHYLMAGAGCVTTYASLARRAQALGFRTKPETIIAYCGYLLKTFALCEVNRFSWKQSRVFADTRKYFSIDPGLITLYRPPEEGLALRLEHAVLLELRRRGAKVCFGTNDSGRELDFLAATGGRSFDRYQVAVRLTADDERRELGAFVLADPYLQAGKNLLLTLDEGEETRNWQGIPIRRCHLIRWLLGFPDVAP